MYGFGCATQAKAGGSNYRACWAGPRSVGGAQKCAGRRVPGRCEQTTKPGLARTLSFWVFHEHEEGEAQRSTQGLRAAKEQILCGHQQGIYVKVAQRVLHLQIGI